MKCQLTITIGDDNSLSIALTNPGEVSPLTLAGALDLVKMSLHRQSLDAIVEVDEEVGDDG